MPTLKAPKEHQCVLWRIDFLLLFYKTDGQSSY